MPNVRPGVGLERCGIDGTRGERIKDQKFVLILAEQLLSDPLDPKANFLFGCLAEEVGMPELAIRAWQAAAGENSADEYSTGAQAAIDSVVQLPPRVDDPHVSGCMAFFNGRFEQAVELLQRAVAADVGGDSAKLHLARAMVAAKRSDDEVAAFLQPLLRQDIGNRRDELVSELAGALFRLGSESAEAAELARKTGEADAKDWAALIEEIRSARKLGSTHRQSEASYLNGEKAAADWKRTLAMLDFKKSYEDYIPFAHTLYRDAMPKVLEALGARCVVNLGVLCAKTDFEIASFHPNIQVLGIDRTEEIKRLNEGHFMRPNLAFMAADIRDVLENLVDPSSTVLFHMRAACAMYPDDLRRVYQKCAEVGVLAISLIEDVGVSRETLSFSASQQSVAFKGYLFLHDYQTLLAEAGYRIESATIRPFGLLWKMFHMRDSQLYQATATLQKSNAAPSRARPS